MQKSEKKLLTWAVNSDRIDSVKSIHDLMTFRLARLNRFFNWYLGHVGHDIFNDKADKNSPESKFYRAKLKEYDDTKELLDLSKYYLNNWNK